MATLENITITAYRKTGTGDDVSWDYVTSTKTTADGTYELRGLSAGIYHLKFSDAEGNYLTEYYSEKTTLDLGTDITVAEGESATGKDASLGATATISGTVTDTPAT